MGERVDYDARLAAAYDLIYQGTGKDYAAEAQAIAGLIRQRHPAADSVLDVACGTGLHLSAFAGLFRHAEGVDVSPHMCAIARSRVPATVTVHEGDMAELGVSRQFSAVTCLFSSIGYLPDAAALCRTLRTFAQHAEPGGVVLIEPWFTPQQWHPGTVNSLTATSNGEYATRMSYSDIEADGMHSVMTMHYLHGIPGQGVKHWSDTHRMTLFTEADYESAFAAAGLAGIEWIPGWKTGRPRIIASKPADAS